MVSAGIVNVTEIMPKPEESPAQPSHPDSKDADGLHGISKVRRFVMEDGNWL